MELKIYYASNGETVGPFNLIEFHNLNLSDDTYVWFQGMPQWEMLKNVADLAVSNISNVANPLNKKLLTELQRRLKIGNRRGVHLNAIPQKSRYKFDLHRLSYIDKNLPDKFIQSLLTELPLKFKISWKNNVSDLNTLFEEDKNQLVKISKSLEILINQTETIELEKGINTFGFGYPILVRRDRIDKKLTVAPVLIWALKIRETKEFNTWEIYRNEDDPIYLNEVLINHLLNDANVTIEQISNEILDDGLISKAELIDICLNLVKAINTQVPDHLYDTFQQEVNSISPIKEKEYYEKLTENSAEGFIDFCGLFSIFEVQKQNIIHDYNGLLALEHLNLLPESPINHSFQSISSIETDPSQQRILHALEDGGKILIQGPPGTGKSQTLTAILINALENHKKTIVVCEKRTALEVLENALLNYGLDHHFILIKDIVKDRKRVVDSVRGRLDTIDFRKQSFNFSKEALDKVINKANGFIHDINKKHRKLGDKYVANKNWTDLVGELLLELNHVKPYVQLDYDVKNFLFTTEEFDEIIQLIDRAILLYKEFKPFEELKVIHIEKYKVDNPYHLNNQIKEAINLYKRSLQQIKESERQYKNDFIEFRNNEYQAELKICRSYLDQLSAVVDKYKNEPLFYDEVKTKRFGFRLGAIFSGKKRQLIKDQATVKDLFQNLAIFLSQAKDVENILWGDTMLHNVSAIKPLEKYFQKPPVLSNDHIASEYAAINLLFYQQPEHQNNHLSQLKNQVQILYTLFNEDQWINFPVQNHTYTDFIHGIEQVIQITEEFLHKEEDPFLHQFNWYQFYLKQPLKYKQLLDELMNREDWRKTFLVFYFNALLNQVANEDLPSNDFDLNELSVTLDGMDTAQLSYIKDYWHSKMIEFSNVFERNNPTLSIENLYNKRSSIRYKRLTLRQIVQFDLDLFTNYFPIILTTPDVCSNLFKGKNNYFDVVMFDEASQLRLEDNLPAILKGKQIIISGDENQMPPSNYFSKVFDGAVEDEDELEEEEDVIKLDKDNILLSCESLLDFGTELNFEKCHLDFHYRSKHPFLIDFSNFAFYNQRLQPLPNPFDYNPIQLFQVNGLYKDYVNQDEADMILDILEKHIQKFPNGKYPSVGIATFNISQRNLIKSKIIDRRKLSKYNDFNEKMQALEGEGLFLKNLENIQGDERDIIILSTTFGKTKEGKFYNRFGPINLTKGFKLLNVIVTRAKYKVFVCTSVPEEIYLNYKEHLEKEAANNRGAVFFAYLAYCKAVSEENNVERIAVLNALSKNSSAEKNNMLQNKSSGFAFGKVVYDVLVQAFGEDKVAAPFQFAGFNIDILFDPKVNGAPKLAIECDGSKKHDQREAYLHDLHRKKILEKGGFVFLRIWSVNWWRNPEREKAKLIAYINEIAQQRLPEGDQLFEHSFVRAKIPNTMVEVEVPVLTKVVKLNSVVRVKYMELSKVITVQIVNYVVKNELKEGVQKISIDSPLAISLLGNREGDLVKIGNLDNFVEIIKID